jgi:hypothetical protein
VRYRHPMIDHGVWTEVRLMARVIERHVQHMMFFGCFGSTLRIREFRRYTDSVGSGDLSRRRSRHCR